MITKYKKLLLSILTCLASVFFVLFCVSCKTDNSDKSAKNIYVSPNKLNIEINEQYKLNIQNDNDIAATWSSDDTGIVTVSDDGTVTGISSGATNVRAMVGDKVALCLVNVLSIKNNAVLQISESSLSISVNGTFDVFAKVIVGNSSITDNITFIVGNSNIVEVKSTDKKESDGVRFTVKGLSIGATGIEFTSVYNGVVVSKSLLIEVVEDVKFSFADNDRLDLSGAIPSVNLYMSAPSSTEYYDVDKNYENLNEISLSVNSVEISKNKIDNPSIKWVSENESVAVVNDGVILPKGKGTTFVFAEYNNHKQAIAVNVQLPEVTVKNLCLDIESVEKSIVLPKYIVDVTAAEIEDRDIFVSYDKNTSSLFYDVSSFKMGDNKKLVIKSKDKQYNICASLVTKVIRTKEDLDEFRTLSKEVYPKDEYLYGGYFVLGDNIDYYGVWPEFLTSNTLNDSDIIINASKGFNGTFDGRGYTINGLITKNAGLINWLAVGGTIRNLGLLNVQNGFSALCRNTGGLIENIFISGSNVDATLDNSFLISIAGDGAVTRNCVIVVDENVGGDKFGPVYTRIKGTDISFDNIIVIGSTEYRDKAGTKPINKDIANPEVFKTYATFEDFVKDYDRSYFDRWGDVWNISEKAALPVLAHTENSIVIDTSVLAGNSYNLTTLLSASVTLQDEIEGVTIKDNKLNISDTVPTNTQIKLLATSLMKKDLVTEKEINVYAPLGNDVVDLNKSVDIDLSKLNGDVLIDLTDTQFKSGTLYLAEIITVKNGLLTAHKGDETILPLTIVNGKTLKISQQTIRDAAAGIYQIKIAVYVNGTLRVYAFDLHLITKIIKTSEDFANLSLGKNNKLGIYTQTERSQGYFVLGANIEYVNPTGISGFRTINGSVKFSGIFDGRGYNINNFVTGDDDNYSGLFRDISGGIVRNVSFTNTVKGVGGGGLIAKRVGGLAIDGSTSNAENKAVGWYAELTNIFVSGKFNDSYTGSGHNISLFIEYADSIGRVAPNYSIVIDNIIINLTEEPAIKEASSRRWGALVTIASTSTQGYGSKMLKQFTNVYVFGTTILGRDNSDNTLNKNWPNTSVYASAESDLTATLGDSTYGDIIAANGSIWKYENGNLTMKSDSETSLILLEDS